MDTDSSYVTQEFSQKGHAAQIQLSEREAPFIEPFESAYAAFEDVARAADGVVEYSFSVAGRNIRLHFAGKSLVPSLTAAFQHLPPPSTTAVDLTVHVWDGVSTNAAMAVQPWTRQGTTTGKEIAGHRSRRFITYSPPEGNALSILDRERNVALFWMDSAAHFPNESRAPLRFILHPWFQMHGRQFVHAAAVGTESGGVLLAGKGGSGKSTTALACLLAGMWYVSDDYCLVTADPRPHVSSLYCTAGLDAGKLEVFPQLARSVANARKPARDKAVLFLQQTYPDQLVQGFAIRAILLPSITGRRDTLMRAVPPGRAMVSLAPSTLFQLPGAAEADFRAMEQLVRAVPCYTIELGTDLAELTTVISGFLAEGRLCRP